MRTVHRVLATIGLACALAACGSKHDDAASRGSDVAKPVTCPPGNVVKDGACAVVMTAEKVAAVAQQQSRLDELAKLLDQVDTVGAPIELLNGFRGLPQWQALKAKSDRLAALDAIGGGLDNAVKTLRAFKASLGEASARLGNLKGQLDHLMTDTGAARRLEDVRAEVSTQLRAAIDPLAAKVEDTIHNALVPLATQLSDASDMMIAGCTMAKLSGGGDKLTELCGQAKDSFAKALVYLGDLKTKPAALFNDVVAQLQAQLGPLVDVETQKLVAAAQVKVNQAIHLPPTAAPPNAPPDAK
jgi:hypothetical protein